MAHGSWNSASFLNFGVGARAMGMGNSFIAIADDATAIYWNPAGLMLLTENQVFVSYADRFGVGIQDQSAGVGLRWRKRVNVGFGFARASLGDIKQTTEGVVDARGRPIVQGVFEDAEIALMFSSGVQIHEILAVGITGKYLLQELADKRANTVALDIGWIVRPTELITLGLVAQNINRPRMKWNTQNSHYDRVSANFKFGAAVSFMESKLRVSGDLIVPDFGSIGLNSGLEYQLTNYLAMRGGLVRDELATGATISWDRIDLDYAYRTQELGDTHRFALHFGF
jgi:hypothetical protein